MANGSFASGFLRNLPAPPPAPPGSASRFAIWPMASHGSAPAPPGSAYSRLHYHCATPSLFKAGCTNTFKASLRPSMMSAQRPSSLLI